VGSEARRHDRRVVTRVGIILALFFSAAPGTHAAVEPGIYFDPERRAPGGRVTLHTAADYVVCFVANSEPNVPDGWVVYLAPAASTAPREGDLVRVEGTWSTEDGAVSFAFVVPSLDPGTYRGYIKCPDGRLDGSANTLVVGLTTPATDSTSGSGGGTPAMSWAFALAAGVGAVAAALSRLGRGRARR
jgi:hypothetical protein